MRLVTYDGRYSFSSCPKLTHAFISCSIRLRDLRLLKDLYWDDARFSAASCRLADFKTLKSLRYTRTFGRKRRIILLEADAKCNSRRKHDVIDATHIPIVAFAGPEGKDDWSPWKVCI